MYSNEYIQYLVHFHSDRDYFECHEVLEEFWKRNTPKQKDSTLVGFILLAVSNYHHRRGNFAGATRTLKKAIAIFQKEKCLGEQFGLNAELLQTVLFNHLTRLLNHQPYSSYSLPFSDHDLLTKCKKLSLQLNLEWDSQSELSNEDIIHRHKRRDRSTVVEERQLALLKRNNIKKDSE